VAVEYHWFDGQYDRMPAVIKDLVRRRVAVIATLNFPSAALTAKAATTTIPIVFSVGDDPVKLGLVASLARPGRNATGANFFSQEAAGRRLGLFHELVPKASRIGVLINPGANSAATEAILRQVENAARVIGLQIDVLKATSSREIEAAFATLASERVEALFAAPNGYFSSQRAQFATLAARYGIAVSFFDRRDVEAGGLMSYGTDYADREVGAYTGQILKGANPADLPVVQSTRFELVINLKTAKALGLTIPPNLLALADEVIE
jgi:putative ABC transport system substrate-binding protein